MIIGGLDPGLKGAFALINAFPKFRLIALTSWDARKGRCAANATSKVIHDAIPRLEELERAVVVCEAAGARPTDSVSSSNRFGRGRGAAEACLIGRGARLTFVSPAKWKRQMGLDSRKVTSMRYARIWAKGWKVKNHDEAEALLLAVWLSLQEAHKRIAPTEGGRFGLFS